MPKAGIFKIIADILGHKFFLIVILVIAFIVSIPAIKADLLIDDLYQRLILIDPDRVPQKIKEMDVIPGNPGSLKTALFQQFSFAHNQAFLTNSIEYGLLPWWAKGGMRASFLRPVSSFTHWLDYRLFPDSPELMHIHSILWFLAGVYLVAIFYRSVFSPVWIAALAALLLVIDQSNFMTVMFIANRNALAALFFGMLSLLAHHKWRQHNSRPASIAAPLFFLCSLLSAEAGLATFAYLFAYAIALEQGPLKKRALSLAPTFLTIVIWRIIYNTLGYGVQSMGIYIDPVYDPFRYIAAVFLRMPLLLINFVNPMSSDFTGALSPNAKMWYLILSGLSLAIVFFVLLPMLRKNRLARFWFIATVCSTLPFCATFVGSRNLLFVSVAAFALIALFIADVLTKADWLKNLKFLRRIPIWFVCILMIIVHIPIAIGGRIAIGNFLTTFMTVISDRNIEDEIATDKDVIFVTSHNPLGKIDLFCDLVRKDIQTPKTFRTLVPALQTIRIQRTDANTIIISSKQDNLFTAPDVGPMHYAYIYQMFHRLVMDSSPKYEAGSTIELKGLKIEIAEVDKNKLPTRIIYKFGKSLDDPSLAWFFFDWYSLHYRKSYNIIEIGQTIEVPGPSYVTLKQALEFVLNN